MPGEPRDSRHNAILVLKLFLVIVAALTLIRCFQSMYALIATWPVPLEAAEPARFRVFDKLRRLLADNLVLTDRGLAFAATVFLIARFLVSIRFLDQAYIESERSAERTFMGLLIHLHFLLAQAGILYWLALLLGSERVDFYPLLLAGLCGVKALWLLYARFAVGREERFRWVLPSALAQAVCAAVLAGLIVLHCSIAVVRRCAAPADLGAVVGIYNGLADYYLTSAVGREVPYSKGRAVFLGVVGALVAGIIAALRWL